MIRILKADSVFSQAIRTRDKWTCQRCGKKYEPPTKALHNSHHFGRGKWSTRYDPENCDSLCYGCHSHFEQNWYLYVEWKKKRMGEKAYKALEIRAHMTGKRDDKLALLEATIFLRLCQDSSDSS